MTVFHRHSGDAILPRSSIAKRPVSNEAVTAILASRGRIADAIRSYEIVIRRNRDPKL
jgi:hypothetical protein